MVVSVYYTQKNIFCDKILKKKYDISDFCREIGFLNPFAFFILAK